MPVFDIIICKLSFSSSISRWRGYCLLVILFGWTWFSCQMGKNKGETQIMSYQVDTVTIDPKERILDIGGYMNVSDLEADGKTFFLYNHHDHSIDEINLDAREYVKTYPLEAEGPNGVGQFVFGLQCLEDNLLFLKTGPSSAVIDKKGRLVQKINWLTAKDSAGDPFGDAPPRMEVVIDTNNLRVMGTNLDFLKSTAFLGILSVQDSLVKNIDVDTKNSFSDYFLKFENNFRPPWVFLWADENYAYISHEYSNEIYIFHPRGELVKVIDYQPKLTPARAIAPEVLSSTRERVRRESRKLLEQVRFVPPVWDKENRRYFRLSSKRVYEDGPKDDMLPLKRNHIFLSVFDEEFNLVSEIELEGLYNENYKHFAKDGKLWVCQNFSDELEFLVFDFQMGWIF